MVSASWWSVIAVAADGVGVEVGVGTAVDVKCAGRSCAACAFFDGSKAERGVTSRFNGHIFFRRLTELEEMPQMAVETLLVNQIQVSGNIEDAVLF